MTENAFAVPLRSKSRVNRRAWGIAIVDRAVLGQADRSMLSHFASLMRCVSLRVQSMSACTKKTPLSQRQYCKKCGGHLLANHPPLGLVDVFAATLPTLEFSPGVHVNYAETVLPSRDGLPKFKDFPAEFGGSGEQIAE